MSSVTIGLCKTSLPQQLPESAEKGIMTDEIGWRIGLFLWSMVWLEGYGTLSCHLLQVETSRLSDRGGLGFRIIIGMDDFPYESMPHDVRPFQTNDSHPLNP